MNPKHRLTLQAVQNLPLHPFLAAAYPVLALLAANLNEVEAWVALRPLAAALLLAALALLAGRWLLRDWNRAALAAALLLLFFFTYGHVYHLLELSSGGVGKLLGHHRVLAPLWLLLGLGALWGADRRLRRSSHPARATAALNLVTAALMVLPLAQVGLGLAQRAAAPARTAHLALGTTTGSPPPDIYYIVLDLYTRQDVLEREFGLDNQPFLASLEDMGFYVARCARSNYESTQLSLASSLNMDYLDEGRDYRTGGDGHAQLTGMIKNGRVRAELEQLGYRTVAFETGFYWTQWMDADIYLTPNRNALQLQALRPFESLLIQSTALSALLDARSALARQAAAAVSFPYSEHIERERFLLARLPALASVSGPKLVFAHVLIPHNPQVFAADGQINQDPGFWSDSDRAINDEYFRRGYAGQVAFINSQIAAIVRQIQQQSSTPPVIIVQGDHGVYYGPDRHAILNALYLPGVDPALLRSDLSPVNTFRLIFNTYFDAGLPLLPDLSYNLDLEGKGGFTPAVDDACQP